MSKVVRIQPVIMSGGAGSRLWPMSRAARPKQFLPLASELTLFQESVARVAGADASAEGYLAPLVIGGKAHTGLIAEQLAAIGAAPAAIIAEPAPRNTAAVAAVAAAWTEAHAPGALALLTPADHHIADADAFRRLVKTAAAAATAGRIVTFGVKPDAPHTGFGYIERGPALDGGVFEVAAFREKPDLETAQRYLAGGRHFWNAGIFLFAPAAMLAELDKHAPEIAAQARAALNAASEADGVLTLDGEAFEACPADSIDYAVMEKTDRAAVAGPAEIGWSDIGSWTAVEGAPAGDANVLALDAEANIVETDGPFVSLIGVSDLIVVATGDAVLVARKDNAQDVKKIVEELKRRGRTDLL